MRWSVDLFHLDSGWRLCTPRSVTFGGGAISELRLEPQHVNLKPKFATDEPGFEAPVEVDGAGPFYLELCWSVGGPVQSNGAYLSARFTPVYGSSAPVGLNQFTPVYVSSSAVGLTRQLNLGTGTTADYSIQSVQPSSDYGGGWQWSRRPPAGDALAVSAVNASETQHDSYKAFLSGIVFGVAGGALVSLIMELVSPFRSRQERRRPESGRLSRRARRGADPASRAGCCSSTMVWSTFDSRGFERPSIAGTPCVYMEISALSTSVRTSA